MDQNIQAYLNKQQQMQQPPQVPPLQQPMQAAMGGMGALGNLGQMAQGQFSDQHNDIYENLRNVLMTLHRQGVPGMDKVINSLNQSHVKQMQTPAAYQGVKGARTGPTQNPLQQIQQGVGQMSQSPMASLLPGQNPSQFIPRMQQLLTQGKIGGQPYAPQMMFGGEMDMPGQPLPGYGTMKMGGDPLPNAMSNADITQQMQVSDPAVLQGLMAKVKMSGIGALSDAEKQLFDSVPLAKWQELSSGRSQAVEKAMTQQAIDQGSGAPSLQSVVQKARTQGFSALTPAQQQLLQGNIPATALGTKAPVPNALSRYEGFESPQTTGTMGGMQEASQIARGFPLLAQIDKASRTGDMNTLRSLAQAMVADPKYKPYLSSIAEYLRKAPAMVDSQKGGINFGAQIGKQDLSQLALDKFGEYNPSDAGNFKGFVSPNGKVINVGGRAGLGDHSSIGELFGQKASDNPFAQNATSYGFMKEANAPRIYREADDVGVQYVNPLNATQLKTIGKSLNPDGGTIYWDGPGKGASGSITYNSIADGLTKLKKTLPIINSEKGGIDFGAQVGGRAVTAVPGSPTASGLQTLKDIANKSETFQSFLENRFTPEGKAALDAVTSGNRSIQDYGYESLKDFFEKTKQGIINQYESQPYLRPGQLPIGKMGGADDLVARDRFNIPELRKLSGGGSDRDVYDLGNGMVLKVAKSARGLAQNNLEGDAYAPVPERFEQGANYAVVKKADPPDAHTKQLVKDLQDAKDFGSKMPAVDMINKVIQKYEAKGDEDTVNMLSDLLNYDPMVNDLTSLRNWGVIDGQPVLTDAGTLSNSILADYKGVKNLSDAEFRKVYYKSRTAKDDFGDTDPNTMYGLLALPAAYKNKRKKN